MKKEVKGNSKKDYFSILKQSFLDTKADKRFCKIFSYQIVYQIIYYLLLAGFLYLGFRYTSSLVDTGALLTLLEEQSAGGSEVLAGIFGGLFALFIVFILIHFLVLGFFEALMWRTTLKKKMSFGFYLRFLGFMLIGFVAALVLLLLGSFFLSSFLIFIVLLVSLFIAHLFFVSLVCVAQENSIKKGISQGLKLGRKKCKFFIIPYLVILALYIINSQISRFLETKIFKVPFIDFQNLYGLGAQLVLYFKDYWPFVFVSSLIGFLFYTYMRIFYVEFVTKIKNI